MSNQEQTTVDQGTGVDQSLQTARIFETAAKMPELKHFVDAIQAAGLENELMAPDLRTLFAPTNEAVSQAPNNFFDELKKPENRERLLTVIRRHIVIGSQTVADLRTTATVRTLEGAPVEVAYEDGTGRFGEARVVHSDIPCTNGHIQVIDKLIVPEYSYSS